MSSSTAEAAGFYTLLGGASPSAPVEEAGCAVCGALLSHVRKQANKNPPAERVVRPSKNPRFSSPENWVLWRSGGLMMRPLLCISTLCCRSLPVYIVRCIPLQMYKALKAPTSTPASRYCRYGLYAVGCSSCSAGYGLYSVGWCLYSADYVQYIFVIASMATPHKSSSCELCGIALNILLHQSLCIFCGN